MRAEGGREGGGGGSGWGWVEGGAKGSRHLEEVLVEGVGAAVDGVRLAPREPARVEAVGRALSEDVRDRARGRLEARRHRAAGCAQHGRQPAELELHTAHLGEVRACPRVVPAVRLDNVQLSRWQPVAVFWERAEQRSSRFVRHSQQPRVATAQVKCTKQAAQHADR